MRMIVLAGVFGFAVSGLFGCARQGSGQQQAAVDSSVHEAALGRVVEALGECNALLAAVKDPKDMSGSKASIEKALEKARKAETELTALPELSAKQKKALDAKFGPELKKCVVQLSTEVGRLQPPVPVAERYSTKSAKSIGPDLGETADGPAIKQKFNQVITKIRVKINKKVGTRTITAVCGVRG